ncbi:hypothetical protein TrRE_jg10692 [Triparma retinervis]|uniref:Uncharacterized protein n=1 Tax=Triparma retinervis TaxID=2557542 RepID=A0A9W7AAP5_9STRA|nr:hypothetical protein TrRE_jg10692 [Triparma retinervis]
MAISVSGWTISGPQKAPLARSTTQLSMFSGAAAGGQADEEAEAQAKAMGMSLKEYQLAMRMRENLAANLNAHRSTGKSGPVSIVYDGNVKPQGCTISSVEGGKEALEKDIMKAWEQAIEGAQKAAQENFQSMQRDVAKEMKGM